MLTRQLGKKSPQKSTKVMGSITSSNDHRVIVKITGDISPYRKGQRIIVSIPHERKTALGKVLKVSEVVAHGKITNISDNIVTIQSKRTNPIISASALHENEGKERLIFVEKVD